MRLEERSYGGHLFRPRPEVYIADDKRIVIIATPWGPSQAAKDFIDIVTSQMREADNDPDQTVMFLKIDSLDMQENRLRMAIMSAHEDIRDKYNDDSASAGLEVLCLIRTEKKVTWFQLGAPFTSILRENKIIPVHHPLDLSFDFSRSHVLPPLPKDLLGLQNFVNLEMGSFRLGHDDRLLLISRSYVPYELFKYAPADMTVDNVTKVLSEDNQEHPFWVGILNFNSF